MYDNHYLEYNNLDKFLHSEEFFDWINSHSLKDIHRCCECPDIIDEFICRYENEKNIPIAYTKFEDFIDDLREIYDYCWCPHFNGKIWWQSESSAKWECPYEEAVDHE